MSALDGVTGPVARFADLLGDRLDVERDPQTTVTLALATAAAALWTVVVTGLLPMPGIGGMEMAMSDPGVPERMGTHNGGYGVATYLLMWGVMMSAMMYPAMIPFARRYVDALDGSRLERAAAVAVTFVAYSGVWTATGVVPLALDALVGLNGVVTDYGTAVVGLAFLSAGAYQFTAFKRGSLATCCDTLDDRFASLPRAVRTGLDHGVQCVRCTWPLFALMALVGSMNLFWMVALTLVVVAERIAPWGDDAAVATGLLGIVAGVAVFVFGLPTFA